MILPIFTVLTDTTPQSGDTTASNWLVLQPSRGNFVLDANNSCQAYFAPVPITLPLLNLLHLVLSRGTQIRHDDWLIWDY